ncbi:PpiC-type peptidyl-prolyl cis-trans isomerase [Allomuricauda ruestringensis DSM 13258]|uniref:Periplasmic chaperone PpiD n=1 Tax=Allomuricauda ruestringensis (strain DSM 13258 / CIP 107369 / LMG 19739 / B1) TaxID=886377 RepID=G2PKV8_ALLRU|nr:SurA N-terminal domain-containing protein [Allomuricauda ruestringensis]AEM69937.1 PpiC-type peptidyl-prolyl cis-trans isomerase [Allomuricauda ruestringensis DSM 13258]
MAILENIRKRTTVLILIIGLALFAFVISGVFSSDNFSGGKVGSTVAEVNGENIPINEFRAQVETASRRYGPSVTSTQLVNMVYDQEVRKTILNQQFEELGIDVESDQIIEFVRTSGYAQIPDFQDENGVFNEQVFKSAIADWKANDPLRYDAWLQDEASIIQAAKERMYFNLVKGGVTATLTEGEMNYNMANDKVDLQYVRIPYTSIADSTIKISKGDIEAYINDHKALFEQDKARDIRFVYFEEKPSAEDENNVKEEITALMDDSVEYSEATDANDTILGFRNTKNMAAFLDRYSDTKLDTIYKAKKDLPSVVADTLMAMSVGEVYGPYKDGDSYKVSKVMDRKENGTVKASHILITWEGAERANPSITRTKEEAEAEAKRLLAEARKEDVIFTALARDNSDGPSAPRGGDLGYFQEGVMADGFNDFCFGNPTGTVGLVETQFGYHIIKVDDKQDVVQVATLAREIEPSETTINTLFTDATKYEMAVMDAEPENFGDIAKESSYTVRPVNKIKEMEENLPGLGSQRSIVQWAFNEDTSVGDIKRFNVNNGYAVVQLTKKYKKGLMAPEDASATALPAIRKELKAKQIIAANKGKAMDAIASDNNVSQSTASAVTLSSPTLPGAGREPLVVGTAFAMDKDQTSDLIKGNTGVYMIKVTNKTEAPDVENYSTYAQNLQTSAAARVNGAVYNALKDKAEIEDKRATFY